VPFVDNACRASSSRQVLIGQNGMTQIGYRSEGGLLNDQKLMLTFVNNIQFAERRNEHRHVDLAGELTC
jgi:hypothetical protein